MKFDDNKHKHEHVETHVQLDEILALNLSSASQSMRVNQSAKLLSLEWQRLKDSYGTKYPSLKHDGSDPRNMPCSNVDNVTEQVLLLSNLMCRP